LRRGTRREDVTNTIVFQWTYGTPAFSRSLQSRDRYPRPGQAGELSTKRSYLMDFTADLKRRLCMGTEQSDGEDHLQQEKYAK
jgi:hypothetical protein